MYIHGIYIVYSACILHPVAGVAEKGRVPFPQIHIPLSEYVPMRRATKATAKGLAAGTENELSFQEYTRYIAGIYLVYTKDQTVDKRLDQVATLAHWYFIVSLPYVWGYPLHLPVSLPCFAGIHTSY